MPRTLQHITFQDRALEAAREGRKVETLCGERVYQMSNMKAEIPTCTPCARALMKAHKKEVLQPRSTWTVSMWNSGGAA